MKQSRLPYPLMAMAMAALLAAIWAGLVRLGWSWPVIQPTLPMAHGPLMVSGFLGTLIGIERAVALRARWAYTGPLASGLGGILLAVGMGGLLGPVLIASGSLAMVVVFVAILRRVTAVYTVVMGLGALSWLVGNLLWLLGWPVFHIVLWWAAFLILTIAGERLELGRLVRLSEFSHLAFLAAIGLFLAGLLVLLPSFHAGVRVAGAGMLALAIWLLRYDIATRTVRKAGLPRFVAVCLLSGYAWLGAAGLMGIVFGGVVAGPRYDALLHAVFLGFVFSMIFGHAPILFPAILGFQVSFHPIFYLHLTLLHSSLLLRMVGDLSFSLSGRLWGGLFNGVALLLFLATTAWMASKSFRAARKVQGRGVGKVNERWAG